VILASLLITATLLGFTRSWTESTPTDNTVANQIDDYNRYLRVDAAERLETYIGGFNASDSNEGFYHILFVEKSASPSTPAANKGLLYGKLINSKCELCWMDEDGDEKQITSGGVLKISAGDLDANSIDEDDIELDNNSYLVAANAAGDGEVELIKADANDLAVIPIQSETSTNAAPTCQKGIANKKYVDDQITAHISLSAYTDQDSEAVTLLKSHAYKAVTDGMVEAYANLLVSGYLKGYVGLTSNPAGAGDLVQSTGFSAGGAAGYTSISFLVAKDEYFEVTTSAAGATIYWKSFGTLSRPIDQD